MTLFMILMHFIPYGLSLLKQKCFNLRPVGYEREGQRLLGDCFKTYIVVFTDISLFVQLTLQR